jgi:hypothetical protein
MMLQRALNADEEDLEFTSWLLGLKNNCSMDELSGNICRFLCDSPNAEQDKISLTNSRATIRKLSFKAVSVAASSKEDVLKALRLRLEKEKELLRMKQQENEHRMRILEHKWRVREAEDDISQNKSEKVKIGCTTIATVFVKTLDHKKVMQSEKENNKNGFLRYQEVG